MKDFVKRLFITIVMALCITLLFLGAKIPNTQSKEETVIKFAKPHTIWSNE